MTRKGSSIYLAGAGLALAMAVGLAACGGGNGATGATSQAKTAGGQAATVDAANEGSLGTILVDSKGFTLYLFKKDSGTKSSCYGDCASDWPPLRASGKPTAGSGVNSSMLGTTPRSDGKPQVTYNGHPLYMYAGDQNPGDTNGEGITAFGAAWFAVSPSGNQVSGQPSSSGGGSSGGGYGY